MMHLVTGGSGSGKSAFAEEQILKLDADENGRRIYIATMIPYGEDGRQRVERHRALRAQKKFETVECYTSLASVNFSGDAVVLLECVSNLTANEVFDSSGAGENAVNAVLTGVRHLNEQVRDLVVVTNEVFSDGVQYDSDTLRYLQYLGKINQELAAMADQVTEVVYGIPVKLK